MLDEELDRLSRFLEGANAATEYPDDAKLRGYGALSFLYLRSDRHQTATLKDFRRLIQPPLDLGFYKLFEVDGVPRSAVLWAFLNPTTERKFLLDRRLDPSDWLSGDQMWVVEIIAPYGQKMGGAAMNWLRQSLPEEIKRVRYMRTTDTNEIRHIVEVNRGAGKIWGAKIVRLEDITG